jgi:hypothetical protein
VDDSDLFHNVCQFRMVSNGKSNTPKHTYPEVLYNEMILQGLSNKSFPKIQKTITYEIDICCTSRMLRYAPRFHGKITKKNRKKNFKKNFKKKFQIIFREIFFNFFLAIMVPRLICTLVQ